MRTLELVGTFEDMGVAHGEACRDEIHVLYARRIANAVEQAHLYGGRTIDEGGLLALSERCLPFVAEYHPAGLEELRGIATGAQLSLTQVWAMNALTDLRDVAAFSAPPDGEGCSSFIVQSDLAAEGRRFCGQTWDLSTDNMPHVLMVRRRPDTGPETLCLTTTGCLSLIGMNAFGVAVGTTNIRSYDSRIGVGYLDVIHKALTEASAEDAVDTIVSAPRAGAHYYYVMDESRAMAVECTAMQHETVEVTTGAYVHCNHFLCDAQKDLEVAGTPVTSSLHRQQRLSTLLERGAPTPDDLMRFLGDTSGGVNAISRHDFNGISSNGSVIMEPARRQLWAVHGPADQSDWTRMSVGPRAPADAG